LSARFLLVSVKHISIFSQVAYQTFCHTVTRFWAILSVKISIPQFYSHRVPTNYSLKSHFNNILLTSLMVFLHPVCQQARSVQFSVLSTSSPSKLDVVIIFSNSSKHIFYHFISLSCLQTFTYSVYGLLVALFPRTRPLYCVRCSRRC
jgi:hypothetical protein